MEERSPPCPSENEEKRRTPQDSNPVPSSSSSPTLTLNLNPNPIPNLSPNTNHNPKPNLNSILTPTLTPPCRPFPPIPAPCSDASALPVDTAKRCAVDTIEAFVRSTEKDEEQKLRFLRSICTICDTTVEENMGQELGIFCRRNELVENIMELLSEEPRGKLCSELRQQAMAAITALRYCPGPGWPHSVCMAPQCLRGPTASGDGHAAHPAAASAPLTLWRLQDEEQKLQFLQSICTICDMTVEENMAQELRIFCRRNELVENIMELLSEEPRGKLCSELRQQAMAAITALSAVEAVLEDKIPLFTTCVQSILLLPSEQDLDISLYTRTLMALDQMLHTLVFVHPTASIGEELQSIFQVLLPFTSLQNAVVRQRAVGRIWKLSHSLALFCQAGPHGSTGRISLARYKELRLPVLGQLVGSLVLCCAYQEDRTRRSAVSALRHLYAFILGRARWESPQGEDQEKLKQWEDDHKFSLSWTTNVTVIVLRFAKHFYSSEKTDFILTALQGMSDCSNYSTQLAATLMDVLMVDFKPAPTDVQRIVMAIHRSRKLITEERAQRTIQTTFPWLAASDPCATTLSLLRCSHTCDKDTWELWEMALSSAGVVPWMVQELLRLLEVAPLGQETEIGTLPLAAAMALHKILQHSQYGPQVCLFVLELFVALIFQMVSSTSLKPLEVTAVTEDAHPHPPLPSGITAVPTASPMA
ncbi:UNVERIFIED_CONTAM: hypothetical protein H355_006234 [Colinus virginianus]|nr:hypothetical protein H355_006234 [Colinus virginianus]